MAAGSHGFRFADFLVRFLFVFALILATYNPTGYSFVHWAVEADMAYLEVKIFIGLSLFLLHSYIAGIARRSLGRAGILLGVLFAVSLIWALDSQELLPQAQAAMIVLVEAILAMVLAMGLSLVLLWTQASGQVTATIEVH